MSDYRQKTMEHYGPSAAAYRRHWAPVLLKCAELLIEALNLEPGHVVLDLGSGTGEGCRRLLEAVGPDGRVVGSDLTVEMLREFRSSSPDVSLVRLDASRLPFTDRSFDRIYSAFMLQHVREQYRSLAEMSRILRAGGRLGLLTWGRHDPGCKAFDVWEDALLEFGAPKKDPSPPPRWDDSIDSEAGVRSLLTSVGFESVQVRRRIFRHQWNIDSLMGLRLRLGEAYRRLSTLPPVRQEQFRVDIRQRLIPLEPEDLLWAPEVIVGTADKA